MRALSISPANIGNLWFLTRNPDIAGLSSGYGYIAALFMLASFAVNLLIRTVTVSAAVLICHTNVPGECLQWHTPSGYTALFGKLFMVGLVALCS